MARLGRLSLGSFSTAGQLPPAQLWTALVYQVTDGLIVGELPLVAPPTWSRTLNGAGANAVTTPLGGRGCASQAFVQSILQSTRYGIALVWEPSGLPVVAGPVQAYQWQDSASQLTIGFGDGWTLLGKRAVLNSGWVSTLPVTDTSADILFANSSLHDIAIGLMQNTLTRGPLAIDLPGVDGGTGNAMSFYGYDNADTGTRVQSVTSTTDQTTGLPGPDVDFNPYFSDTSHIRLQALVGNPQLSQPNQPIAFDYGSTALYVDITGDKSKQSNETIVKGSGSDRTTLFAYSVQSAAITSGDPLMDYQDSNNTDQSVQTALNAIAAQDSAQYLSPSEQWTATVLVAGQAYNAVSPAFGSYAPGDYVTMASQGHFLIPDGQYLLRIQQMASSDVADGISFASLTFYATGGIV